MCPLRPTPSASYLEIGSRPEIPIDSRACSQISEFWQMWPSINRELWSLLDLLSSPASILIGFFFIFSRFFCSRLVSFLLDLLCEPSLLSKCNSSVQERFCRTALGWWFKFGKSFLRASMTSLFLSL